MKPKLVIIFLFIIVLPLALLLFLGYRVAQYEQEGVQRKFQELLLNQLADVDRTIMKFMEQRERDLLNQISSLACEPSSLRKATRENAFIRQFFCLDAQGDIRFPDPHHDLSEAEWDFLERTKDILIGKNLIGRSENISGTGQISNAAPQINKKSIQSRNQAIPMEQIVTPQGGQIQNGWFTWYWGRGINLIFWYQNQAGTIIGAEVDRIRLLADIIGILPETNPETPLPLQGRILLTNTLGETVYQWGKYDPGKNETPLVEKSVTYPLSIWKLGFYIPPDQLRDVRGKSLYVSLILGMLALSLTLTGLALYFYRENSREMREAARRVSFVNQVSHELKTPLTNIRLYAELLEQHLVDEDEKTQRHLQVIVSESQRLSRLIGNILTFSRKQRQKLTLQMKTGQIDEMINTVLSHFTASFEKLRIKVNFQAEAGTPVLFDRDCVKQILGNLFNNVEKYAADGGVLSIVSHHENGQTVITVRDLGPGIPFREKERIFLPFTRLSNKLTNGVSGTGIGLAIARDMARLHGGDLVLLSSQKGASFELRINTPESD